MLTKEEANRLLDDINSQRKKGDRIIYTQGKIYIIGKEELEALKEKREHEAKTSQTTDNTRKVQESPRELL